jgi:asparagine synthase (glutamine-hydrolysing)
MCGIAGALDLTGTREFSQQRLLAMTGAIAHRGPDDEHAHVEPGVALGARRLSIIDLAGGRQPIGNEDGTVWVAFNGELFEYPELRRELLSRGHRLATRCDTEAWVHLYEDAGEEVFQRARGQFAVSLWDRKSRTLILGRDRVGICPLYYTQADGWLLWGSEIKALLASGLVAARPDLRGVDHLFTFFCAGTTRTFFEEIKSLPPGNFLKIRDGRITQRRYWDLDFPDAGSERRLADPTPLVEELEALLERAIERRLRSDVPVVTYISGGLDSTVVLGFCSRHRGEPIPAFTVGLDRAGPDERAHSREAAAVLGSPLTTIAIDRSGIAAAFPELVRAAEGPVLDTSCAALLRLAESVHAQGYKVALTGEGADEALAGYVWYKTQKIRDGITRRIGPALPRLARRLLAASVAGRKCRLPAERAIGGVRPAQQDLYDLISQVKPILYSSDMQQRLGDHSPYADLDITNDRITRWHTLNQSLYVGYKVMLAGLLMISKGDRIAMSSSVETRYPFLDEDLIDFCAGIAPEYKMHGLNEKWILRQVAARVLPRQIADRPKTMFRACMSGSFLSAERPAWVDQLLSPESLRATGYFDPAGVATQRAWQVRLPRITPARFVFDVGLTCVVSTQLWHHIYCGGGLCDLPTWQPVGRRHGVRPKHLTGLVHGPG